MELPPCCHSASGKAQLRRESALYNHLWDPRRVTHYLNPKTPEETPPPFPEDVKHHYSNTPNPQMCLGFPETAEGTSETITWDTHVHLSLQDILS